VACVIGDTVGDPFKDTSGPSLNILIKLMSVISLTMAPLMAGNGDWPATWYIGLVCIILLIIGTYLVYYFFWKGVDTMNFDDKLTPATKKESTATFTGYTNESAKSSQISFAAYAKPIDEEAPPEGAPAVSDSSQNDEEAPSMDATDH